MNLKRTFLVELLVLMLMLSITGPVFSQASPGKPMAYAGVIEWVSRDFKYFGINEHKLPITPETKVMDGEGNMLKVSDLKAGRNVVLQSIRNPDGSTEMRIIIKK